MQFQKIFKLPPPPHRRFFVLHSPSLQEIPVKLQKCLAFKTPLPLGTINHQRERADSHDGNQLLFDMYTVLFLTRVLNTFSLAIPFPSQCVILLIQCSFTSCFQCSLRPLWITRIKERHMNVHSKCYLYLLKIFFF